MSESLIEVVPLAGDAAERGEKLGRLRHAEIRSFLDDWMRSLRRGGVDDPPAYVRDLLRETDFRSTIEEHAPELLAEVRAIAAGSGLSAELVLASQFMDEEWAYRARRYRAPPADKCSSFALRGTDGDTWIGQNMDLGAYTDGHQVLLSVPATEGQPAQLIFTIGGMIGLMGVSTSLGVCVNALPQLRAETTGVPVAFVIRLLLAAPSLEAAVARLRSLPHATGQHYLLADRGTIRAFEASPDGVVEFLPGNSACVLHTNHPLTEIPTMNDGNAVLKVNSHARLESLGRSLHGQPVSVDWLKAALSSRDDPLHPVSRAAGIGGELESIIMTTGSILSRLSGSSAVEVWASAGPPHLRPYRRIELRP